MVAIRGENEELRASIETAWLLRHKKKPSLFHVPRCKHTNTHTHTHTHTHNVLIHTSALKCRRRLHAIVLVRCVIADRTEDGPYLVIAVVSRACVPC